MASTGSAPAVLCAPASYRFVFEKSTAGGVTTVKIPVFKDDGRRPDLTPVQLIALAMLNMRTIWKTPDLIQQWIYDHFQFYRAKQSRHTYYGWGHPSNWPLEHSLSDAIKRELDDQCNRDELLFYRSSLDYAWDYTFAPGAKRIIFAAFNIDPVPFPFMRLPVELRAQVYGYVLHYSTDGARLHVHPSGRLHRTGGSFPLGYPWTTLAPMQSVLALLSVSKQVNVEALPMFYRYNHFEFTDQSNRMRTFEAFLERMGPVRREHLAHVTIEHVITSKNSNVGLYKGFRLLAQSKNLRTFHFIVSLRSLAKPESIRVPGLQFMACLRGLEQVIFTYSSMTEAEMTWMNEVRKSMLLPKSEGSQTHSKTTASRKGKAKAADDDDANGQPSEKRTKRETTAAPDQGASDITI